MQPESPPTKKEDKKEDDKKRWVEDLFVDMNVLDVQSGGDAQKAWSMLKMNVLKQLGFITVEGGDVQDDRTTDRPKPDTPTPTRTGLPASPERVPETKQPKTS